MDASVSEIISNLSNLETGFGDGKDSKIIALAKKIRRLNITLEKEKTLNSTYCNKIKELENEKNTKDEKTDQISLPEIPKERNKSESKSLKDRISHLTRKLEEERSQSQVLKNELRSFHKALQNEVGEDIPVETILTQNSNWKGRAQTIILLKEKVNRLKEQLAMNSDTPDANSVVDDYSDTVSIKTSQIASNHYDQRNKFSIKRMEAERRIENERMAAEFEVSICSK
ncbi:Coiled-coil domain-containing protein 13 [Nowakowskiella sp. JEL0407]|nr:Coiled-coil domain-containing protein 13 [Nowakowskiella sp. JEL0407]